MEFNARATPVIPSGFMRGICFFINTMMHHEEADPSPDEAGLRTTMNKLQA